MWSFWSTTTLLSDNHLFTHQVDDRSFFFHTYVRQKLSFKEFFYKIQADIYQKTFCRAQTLQKEMRSLHTLIRTTITLIYPQYRVLLGNKCSKLNDLFCNYQDTFYVLVTIHTLFYLVVFIYSSSFMLCLSFNMFKNLECLCCFLFFSHKNVYLHRVCLYDSIELNKHNFIIATIIISNKENCYFP